MTKRLKILNPLVWVTVIIPTALAVLYFGLLAQDVYISESRIVVRNPDQAAPSVLDAALGQTGFGQPSEGNSTVVAYLRSRQAIDEGNSDGFFTGAYGRDDIFWLDRFGSLWGSSDEEFYSYFSEQLDVDEGATTKVLTIRVSAFDPAEAQQINQRLVAQSEALVNSLAGRAQADLIAIAEGEVEAAADAARLASLELANFRDTSGIVDPEQQSEVGLQMISKLQDELIAAQTRLRQLRTYTPQASQIPFLQTQVNELQSQIANARSELTGGRASLASSIAQYQELEVNAAFAESQLAATRASLQEARAEARRQQAYLEQISAPSLPDYPVEPRRIRSIIATFILGLLAWGVLYMLAIGVREHQD
ncbi:hypothetical protein [uncultured Erythrobacter sp.]|uniref:hypothetical protein n=1 Tax=uncultured Erythrobacter sp. TaxID=263913 RepID=UPI0026156BF3|nr:hypothetical protein [uncultured Erythrobacter sp.]